MKAWYNKNDCEHLQAYHAYYPLPVAALFWCGVPPDEVQDELNRASPHPQIRGVFQHPYIPCFEVRCRILHDAIESGTLAASRENGKVTSDHIAPERRHLSRENLKAWIAKEHPADKPSFLFDEIERTTHTAINADAYKSLQADRDAAHAEVGRLKGRLKQAVDELGTTQGERDSLRAMVDKQSAPSARAETTYLNIIGGLLGLMLGTTPSGQKGSLYDTQASIISALLAHHEGKPGMSDTTLENKFAEAKRSIRAA
ncbi:MAG: hypothetical protein KBF33_02250 [Comamonas sp.]|nr:hypothetical protein [Comamonas sp.]